MNKDDDLENRRLLKELYDIDNEEISKMSDKEVSDKLAEQHEGRIKSKKNPNQFWIINGLPSPKEHEIKGGKWKGVVIVISLFTVLAGFFAMFMILAFR